MSNLICHECYSKPPLIRVPLAFPLLLSDILLEYPNFINIKSEFLKYYAYSHTNNIWEPFPCHEFRLAQEYFDFDGGIIVLGRSRSDEDEAKTKEILKNDKQKRKQLKKERRKEKLKINKILSI